MNEPIITSYGQNSAQWYVIHTHALQESRAEKNLAMWGVEAFNPKFKSHCSASALQKVTFAIKSLFPCYIFARFNPSLMLHKIGFTRGVRKIVSFNGSPVPVAEEIVDLIKSRVEEDGFIKVSQNLRPGDEVVVVKGPLADLAGVFESDLNESDRVVVLLKTVSYQSRVVIERDSVKKVSQARCKPVLLVK